MREKEKWVGFVSGCLSGQSTEEAEVFLVSARCDLVFAFVVSSFLTASGSLSLTGKHEWPCSVGSNHRIQAQRTHTLIRFCKALGERQGGV